MTHDPSDLVLAVNEQGNTPAEQAFPERGYSGVRITPPPKQFVSITRPSSEAPLGSIFEPVMTSERQARILTSAALLGVFMIILLHEAGHWISGLILTGEVPDFYVVAVRQKVTEFSTVNGVITWGAGPLVQLAVVWALVLLSTSRGRISPRFLAMAGAGALFSVVSQLGIWVIASVSSSDSWGNDLPRVATFLGSSDRLWMHLLSALFFIATLAAARRWWRTVRVLEHRGLQTTSAVVGAIEGGVFLVVATLFVSFLT